MLDIDAAVQNMLKHAADTMTWTVNKRCHPGEIIVGCTAWLPTEHLKLPDGLTLKFATQFVGLFPETKIITPVSFYLTLPVE